MTLLVVVAEVVELKKTEFPLLMMMMMVLRTPWLSDVPLEIFSVVLFVCKVKEHKQSIKSQTPKPKILKTKKKNRSTNDCFLTAKNCF